MMITFLPLYFTPLLLLVFGPSLIIGIYSFIKVNELWKLKQIGSKELISGFIISITLFGLLKLIYQGEKETFSIVFVGPFLMIFLPFIAHIFAKNIKKINIISKISLLAISFTMIGLVLKMILKSI